MDQFASFLQARVHVLEQIVKGGEVSDTLEILCRETEEIDPAMRCSVLYYDQDANCLRHAAGPSLPDYYNAAIDGLQPAMGAGSCGTAAFTGERVIVEDVLSHPYWEAFRDLAKKVGFHACWSQPIYSKNKEVLGTFAMYYDEVRRPTEEELQLIQAQANLASLTIERKRDEEALQQSEERFKDFTDASSDWFWEMGPDLRFTSYSPRVEKAIGISRDWLIGKTRQEQGRPEIDDEKWIHHLDALKAHEPFKDFEYGLTREDGTKVYVQASGVPVFGDGGEFLGYRGTGTNVTRRVVTDEELKRHRDHLEELVALRTSEVRESEEKYRSLYNDTPAMQHSLDQDMRLIMVSDYWLSYLGYTRDKVIGHKFSEFITGAMQQTAEKSFSALKKTGKTEDLALQFVKSNGEVIDVSLSAICISNSQGEFDRSLAVMIDVTEEMRAKEALSKALESEKEYTALQSKFISLVSHEFRTPLTIIDSAAQRLVRSKEAITPEVLRNRSEKIRTAVGRMTDLIENTLYAARLEENKIELTPVAIDLGDMLGEICSIHGDVSPDHDIHVDVKGLPSTIVADEKLLSIVFTNLLSNAIKFAPASPSIEVKGWTDDKHAVVSVADHGVGIPKEDLPVMFERFFRAKTAEGIKGTGIGLNVSKEFIEMHGGAIEVDSIEGEGSTFTVRLPINGPDQ